MTNEMKGKVKNVDRMKEGNVSTVNKTFAKSPLST